WFAHERGHIMRYTPQTNAWRLYTHNDGLNPQPHPTIYQTQDKTIWAIFGNGRVGLCRLEGNRWHELDLRTVGGRNHNLSILQTRDNTLWIGGRGNLHAYKNNAWSIYRTPDIPIPPTRIVALTEARDGALWVAGMGKFVARLSGPQNMSITTFEGLNFQCETTDSTRWFLSSDHSAIARDLQSDTWVRYDINDGLIDRPKSIVYTNRHHHYHPPVDAIGFGQTADSTLWAGGFYGLRILRPPFNGQPWQTLTNSQLQIAPSLLKSLSKIGNTACNVVTTAQNGNLWVGSRYYGLMRYNGRSIDFFNTEDGLASSDIKSVLTIKITPTS
ncbi:MAG: hypothetical protein QGG64_00705, partial [Candidatus Latescibacteria bacterium]|nr:hypothetical protein [Candidatus Latescibacterota bacterium]